MRLAVKNIEELTFLVNSELGEFCNEFQDYRKKIFKKKRVAIRGLLFRHTGKGRNWSINPGGGTELQFHLYLNQDSIGYGLGFNTQYVPHKNEFSTVQYMEPYAKAFLSNPKLERKLLQLGYSYLHGEKSEIINLEHDQYVLLGKEVSVGFNGAEYVIDSNELNQLVKNIREELFDAYKQIVSEALKLKRHNTGLSQYNPKKRTKSAKKIQNRIDEKLTIDLDNLKINEHPHDYLSDHKAQIEIGNKAEQIVIADEINFLSKTHPHLADKVRSVANNPNLGFDVLSFEVDGTQKQIEVKALAKTPDDFSFYISEHELLMSQKYSNYYLYGVSEINSKKPKILRIKNPNFEDETLFQKEAITYKINFR